MVDFIDGTAFNNEQGNRARKLFAAVVLAALDDAIACIDVGCLSDLDVLRLCLRNTDDRL